jgi:glycosyltransferase involved in cell wall biosynthesis
VTVCAPSLRPFMSAAPIRVLHLHSGNIFGGVESILLSLVKHGPLCPGLEWRFGLCFPGNVEEQLRGAGASVAPLAPVRFSRPWTVITARRAAARLIRESGAHVCLVHSAWTQAVFGPVCRRAGVPFVLWLHSPQRGAGWTHRLARRCLPNAILAVSRHTESQRDSAYLRIPSDVIYTPLPYRSLHATVAPRAEVRRELGAAPEDVVIIQVSRMEEWKGHKVLLPALAKFRDRPGWVCWQVGGIDRPEEKAYFEELKAMAGALGIADRIRFLGRRNDVPSLLGAADIYCQANLDTEGFSIAFLEACLARLPLVTTDVGSAAEIVGPDNGRLVPVGAEAPLAEALGELMASAARRKELGEGGWAKAFRMCDPATQMARMETFFRGVR